MNTYTPGNVIVMTATFTDPDTFAAVIPNVVSLRIKDPSLTETDHSPTSPSDGVYVGQQTASAPGLWHYRFEASGNYLAAVEGQFMVAPTVFT